MRGTTEVQLKRCETRGRIDGVYIIETYKRQCAGPTSLIALDMEAKRLNDCLVEMLTGTISLRIEAGGHLQLDIHELVEGLLETRDKQLVTVRDNVEREAILTVPMLEGKCSEILGRDVHIGRDWAEIGTKTVRDCRNAVKTIVFG